VKPAWRGPVLVAVGSALLVAAIQFGHFARQHPQTSADSWLGGIIGGQLAALAVWASWSTEAVWKRIAAVVAYSWVPSCFTAWHGWLRHGTFLEDPEVFLPDALVLAVLMAILISVRWLFGYRLSNAPSYGATLGARTFHLAEIFALTFVVAAALGIILPVIPPTDQMHMEIKEICFQLAQLGLAVGYVLATLFPCSRVALSNRFSVVWLVALLGYLTLATMVTAESISGLLSWRYGPLSSTEAWDIRKGIFVLATGFCMSLLPTLYLLRLVGFRLVIGSAGADRMTTCDTVRC
jgi:hypothetical protein